MLSAFFSLGQQCDVTRARLKAKASTEWRAYTEYPFTNGLADGTLAENALGYYLTQDYLFLIEFARAYALSRATPRLACSAIGRRAACRDRPRWCMRPA